MSFIPFLLSLVSLSLFLATILGLFKPSWVLGSYKAHGKNKERVLLHYGVIFVISITALFVARSYSQHVAIEIDSQRVRGVHQIQSSLSFYFQKKGRYPSNLSVLKEEKFVVPQSLPSYNLEKTACNGVDFNSYQYTPKKPDFSHYALGVCLKNVDNWANSSVLATDNDQSPACGIEGAITGKDPNYVVCSSN